MNQTNNSLKKRQKSENCPTPFFKGRTHRASGLEPNGSSQKIKELVLTLHPWVLKNQRTRQKAYIEIQNLCPFLCKTHPAFFDNFLNLKLELILI
jgi:hypothetical protein